MLISPQVRTTRYRDIKVIHKTQVLVDNLYLLSGFFLQHLQVQDIGGSSFLGISPGETQAVVGLSLPLGVSKPFIGPMSHTLTCQVAIV